MPRIDQKEYDEVMRTIEENSCFKFSAGTTDSGAFLIPVDSNNQPMDTPKHFSWKKLKGMACTFKKYKPRMMKLTKSPSSKAEAENKADPK